MKTEFEYVIFIKKSSGNFVKKSVTFLNYALR